MTSAIVPTFNLSFIFLKIKKWLGVKSLFVNYFWFTSLGALFSLFFHNEWVINFVFPLILYSLGIKYVRCCTKLNVFDLLWLLVSCGILITWLINDYPNKSTLIWKAVTLELSYMMAYWIARGSNINYLQLIVSKAKLPLFIVCVIGIYCFFFPPSWYQSVTDDAVEFAYGNNIDSSSILEMYRLRSIYVSPYYLAYFCSIALIFEFYLLFKFNKKDIPHFQYHFFLILLYFFTGMLCMMRAPLTCAIVSLFTAYLYSLFYLNSNGGTKRILQILGFLGIVTIVIIPYIDFSTVDFIYEKVNQITDDDDNFIIKRMFLQEQSVTLFGEGYGRYSRLAFYMFNMPSIPDGEYMKIVAEQGLFGLFLLCFMFFLGWVKAIKYVKDLYIEICLISFLLICMIGANPLSMWDKHCILYWLALGQISRYCK